MCSINMNEKGLSRKSATNVAILPTSPSVHTEAAVVLLGADSGDGNQAIFGYSGLEL